MKVGFVGPYSTANLGDYAMLVNNIYDLKCHNVTVFTYSQKFPKISLDLYCDKYNIEYIEPKLKDDLEWDYLNKNNNLTPMDILFCLENIEELENSIKKLDVVIVSGGGWLNHFWAKRKDKVFKIMTPLLIAQQLNKKIVFTANGIGPFDDTKEFYQYFFSYIYSAELAVRDKFTSTYYLKEVGVSENKVKYLPDDLYIINKSILNFKRNFEVKSLNYIVMEMFYPMDILQQNINKIKEFAKEIKEKYNLDIVFLPYDLVFYGLDQARYLHKNISNSELIDIESIGFLPIHDAFHIIKNAKFMLSSRYHGLVLSLAAQTPVIYRTLPTNNDMRYSYSKAVGLIRRVFDGIEIDEHKFIETDLNTTLNKISQNLNELVTYQQEKFFNRKYSDNRDYLEIDRIKYLNSI